MRDPTPSEAIELAVLTIASHQLGLFTLDQAMGSGWTEQRLDRRLQARRIKRLHRSVFAVHGAPDTWERSVLAAVLAAGPGAVASHEAAAALHGFEYAAPRGHARIALSLPRARDAQRPALRVHRVLLPPDHVEVVDGIPVTTYERTLVDMTGTLSLGQLARVLDAGLVKNQVRIDRLGRMLDRLGPAPGRRCKALRLLLAERGPESERSDSTTEIRMLTALRAAGVRMPVPQYRVTVAGEVFRFDAAYPDCLFALEYLGWDPHRTRTAFDRDHRRDRLLSLEGWTIAYFTSASTDREIVRTTRRMLERHSERAV